MTKDEHEILMKAYNIIGELLVKSNVPVIGLHATEPLSKLETVIKEYFGVSPIVPFNTESREYDVCYMRTLLCYIAVNTLKIQQAAIALHLKRSTSQVDHYNRQAKNWIEINAEFKKQLNEIQELLCQIHTTK